MEKIKFSNIQKKCMYCGKMYPSNWGGEYCTCRDHGRLFAVGGLYQPKKGDKRDGN